MTVDRGGLQYSINVDGNYRQGLRDFREQVAKTRAEVQTLRDAQATPRRGSTSAKRDAEATKNARIRAKAIRALNKETEKQAVAAEAAAMSERQNFVVQRRARREAELRAEAERKVSRLREREARITATANALYAQNAKVTQDMALAAGTASRARIKQTRETKKLTAAEAALQRVLEKRALVLQKAEVFNRAGLLSGPQGLTTDELVREGLASRVRGGGRATPSPEEQKRQLTFWGRLKEAIRSTDGHANRISFTFRRLFGILAAFTAARLAVAGFVALVRRSVEFNANLEQATLGVAALLTAVGDVRNAFGQPVSDTQRLVLAQEAARHQLQLLRRDGLRTAATFETLAETFQIALAPGLTAGLNLDEIREFTVRISQAAAAIGLPQNQLAEEIRSLLSGTIQARTTRIATALGITNEDIRRARQAGELAQFLEQRFAAFQQAGERAMGTFNALVSNTRDAMLQLIGAGSLQFFEQLKLLLGDIQGLAVDTDPISGVLEPNPRAVQVIAALSAGMAAAVAEARALSEALGFEDMIDLATLMGGAMAATARVARSLTVGLVQGANDLAAAANLLLELSGVGGVLGSDGAADLVTQGARVATIVAGLLVAIKAVDLLIRPLISKSGLLFRLGRGLLAVMGAVSIPMAAVVAAAAAFAAAVIVVIARVERWAGKTGAVHDAVVFLGEALSGVYDIIANGINVALEKSADIIETVLDSARQLISGQDAAGSGGGANRLSDRMREVAVSVEAARKGLAAQEGLLDKLALAARRAQRELAFRMSAAGLEGAVRQQRQVMAEALSSFDEQAKPFLEEQVQNQEHLTGLAARRADLETRLGQLTRANADAVKDAVAGYRTIAERQQRISDLTATQAAQDRARSRYLAEGNLALAQAAAAQIEQTQRRIDSEQALVELAKVQLDRRFEHLASGELLKDLVVETVRLTQEETAALAAQAAIRRDLARLQQEATRAARAEQTAIAFEAGLALMREARLLKAEADAAVASLAVADAPREVQDRVAAQAALDIKREEVRLARGLRAQEEAALAAIQRKAAARLAELETQRRVTTDEAEFARLTGLISDERRLQAALESQRLELAARNVQLKRLEAAAVADLIRLRAVEQKKVDDPFGAALDDLEQRLPTAFERTRDVVVGLVQGLAATITDSIVDAFDPTQDKSIKERFGRFLQDLARMVIQTMAEIAITRALLNASSGGLLGLVGLSGGGSVGQAAGRARGGRVPRRAAASMAHLDAPGFASGGRPAGLSPRDTVPIWADPKEWVLRREAVSLYGHRVMDALNRGLIDPLSLRAMAGVRSSEGVRTRRGRVGFATGGSVSEAARPAAGPAPAQTTVLPVMPASDENIERLLHGGRNGLLRVIEDNAAAINQVLGR